MDIEELLRKDEAVRPTPYLDCCSKGWRECCCEVKGNLTVGVGRNLDAVPFTDTEISMMLSLDISRAIEAARSLCSIYDKLSRPRQVVLISMAFNMGKTKLAKFVRMWSAIHLEDFETAADEILDSRAGKKIVKRYERLAEMMRKR